MQNLTIIGRRRNWFGVEDAPGLIGECLYGFLDDVATSLLVTCCRGDQPLLFGIYVRMDEQELRNNEKGVTVV